MTFCVGYLHQELGSRCVPGVRVFGAATNPSDFKRQKGSRGPAPLNRSRKTSVLVNIHSRPPSKRHSSTNIATRTEQLLCWVRSKNSFQTVPQTASYDCQRLRTGARLPKLGSLWMDPQNRMWMLCVYVLLMLDQLRQPQLLKVHTKTSEPVDRFFVGQMGKIACMPPPVGTMV